MIEGELRLGALTQVIILAPPVRPAEHPPRRLADAASAFSPKLQQGMVEKGWAHGFLEDLRRIGNHQQVRTGSLFTEASMGIFRGKRKHLEPLPGVVDSGCA